MESLRPARKTEWIGLAAAAAMALLWFTAGLWKLTDISGWQLKLTQLLLVPAGLSLAGTLLVGISEVAAGVLLLRPAWRRWGGWLSAALLAGFMVYMGVNYTASPRRGLLVLPVAGASRGAGVLLE